MRRKVVLAGLLTGALLAAIKLTNTLMAPAIGAATVLQMEASNTSYLTSMLVISGAPLASVVLIGLFAIALYLIVRSEK